MDIDAINSETIDIYYIAHQFWEQDGPKKLLMDTVKRLSVNDKAYMRTPINSDGRSWHSSKQNTVERIPSGQVELSFVHSIYEMWKLRWLIFRSRSEMAADKVLKKFKHQSGDFFYSKTSTFSEAVC